MMTMTKTPVLHGAASGYAVRGGHSCVDAQGGDRQRFVGGLRNAGPRVLGGRILATDLIASEVKTVRTQPAIAWTQLLPTFLPTGTSTYGPPV